MQSDSVGSGFFGHGLIALVISIAILAISFLLATGILGGGEEKGPMDKKPKPRKEDADRFPELLEPPVFPATDSGGRSDRARRKLPVGEPEDMDLYKVRREREK